MANIKSVLMMGQSNMAGRGDLNRNVFNCRNLRYADRIRTMVLF